MKDFNSAAVTGGKALDVKAESGKPKNDQKTKVMDTCREINHG